MQVPNVLLKARTKALTELLLQELAREGAGTEKMTREREMPCTAGPLHVQKGAWARLVGRNLDV